jgi:hypothetical protein
VSSNCYAEGIEIERRDAGRMHTICGSMCALLEVPRPDDSSYDYSTSRKVYSRGVSVGKLA